jgi:hypothetical protein
LLFFAAFLHYWQYYVRGFGGPQGAPTRFDIEEILIKALAMPVLALGNPGEAYGVGRILENENSWKSTVSNLMRQASLILCMPSGRPGSQWELDEILRIQYLRKTVFLMPWMPRYWRRRKDLKSDWDTVVAHLKKRGLESPALSSKRAPVCDKANGVLCRR